MSENLALTIEQIKKTLEKKGLPIHIEDISNIKKFGEGLKLFENGKYLEALEVFSTLIGYQEHELIRMYLGVCHYRLENYESAYKHFFYLVKQSTKKTKDIAVSMLAAIEIHMGNNEKAIVILKQLPPTTFNLINLSIAYWRKYEINKEEVFIYEALRILNKIDDYSIREKSLCKIYHLKALIHQVQKNLLVAQDFYNKALESSTIVSSSLIQDYAYLQIKNEQYEEALHLITKLRSLLCDTKGIEKFYIAKLHDKGLQLFNQKHYEEAIEIYFKILGIQDDYLARKYLGLCYFHIHHLNSAYKHFIYLSKQVDEKYRNFANSMLIAIEISKKKYTKAIQLLKMLPQTIWVTLTEIYLYWNKYKIEKNDFIIRNALKILEKLDQDNIEVQYYTNYLKAMIHQAMINFKMAETYYIRALQNTQYDLEKANLLNDYASLLIESSRYDEAEIILNTACEFILDEKCLEKAYNDKWFGILYFQKKEYYKSKEYLEKAAITIKEKSLIEEIAIVNFLLVNTFKQNDFYKAADYYVDGVIFERLAEKVDERDEKLLQFYFDHVVKF